MKEQQRAAPVQQNRQDREQEQSRAGPQGAIRMPTQQWAHILRHAGGDLLDLPAPLLDQLARGIGNSQLAELLRQGSGEGPALCTPEDLRWSADDLEANPIRTTPPMLFSLESWPGGAHLRPVRPVLRRLGE